MRTMEEQKVILEMLQKRGKSFKDLDARKEFNQDCYKKLGYKNRIPATTTKNMSRVFTRVKENKPFTWIEKDKKFTKIFADCVRIYGNGQGNPKYQDKKNVPNVVPSADNEEVVNVRRSTRSSVVSAAHDTPNEPEEAHEYEDASEVDERSIFIQNQYVMIKKLGEIKQLMINISESLCRR